MRRWLARLLCGAELDELTRWRTWSRAARAELGEFPDAVEVLAYLEAARNDAIGPYWNPSAMRGRMLRRQATSRLKGSPDSLNVGVELPEMGGPQERELRRKLILKGVVRTESIPPGWRATPEGARHLHGDPLSPKPVVRTTSRARPGLARVPDA
ncbi:hypothetical protein IMZ29_00965 [Achromobacter sp. GG226]|uniref:hypothetical protein n=1 Tax=Verticiella alkaliphila TaxID=2779529 RepID=UPI001C0CF815|nr:hypothetical protein [Verticiella sp. GG226]MBU4609174.1 hypothetical protein [Verticiella sp. GG226]